MVAILNKILLSMICGFIGAFIFFMIQAHFHRQELAVIQMDKILKHHIEEQGREELDNKTIENRSERFNRALTHTIQEVSSEFNIVLLVAPAIVTDVPDYTDLVITRIKKRIHNSEG